MAMNVTVGIMAPVLTEMAMDVEMAPAVGMLVAMKMQTVAPQAKEHLPAQQDQHHADDTFQHLGQGVTEAQIQEDSRTGKDQQGQRMPQAPNRAVGGDPANRSRARAKRRHSRDVIGLQSMLHAKHKSQQKNARHNLCPRKGMLPIICSQASIQKVSTVRFVEFC